MVRSFPSVMWGTGLEGESDASWRIHGYFPFCGEIGDGESSSWREYQLLARERERECIECLTSRYTESIIIQHSYPGDLNISYCNSEAIWFSVENSSWGDLRIRAWNIKNFIGFCKKKGHSFLEILSYFQYLGSIKNNTWIKGIHKNGLPSPNILKNMKNCFCEERCW